MAFDEQLAARVRALIGQRRGVTEKKMFGGLAFLVNGNMSCGVHGNALIVRIAPETTETSLRERGARPFDLTGRPMKGWLLVDAGAVRTETALSKWVQRGMEFAASLPKKEPQRAR